jgi:nicotinate-nucleotide adenylyltransferase
VPASGADHAVGRRRVGLYGGSFNPIHIGHLRTAVEVREGADLAEVWLVPVHVPAHKEGQGLADGRQRLRMIELGIAGLPGLRACDVELTRPGPSFTIDTVRILKQRHPEVDFTLVVGFDAFREIHTWKDYARLFGECDLLVTSRPPDELHRSEDGGRVDALPIAVTEAFCYDEQLRCYTHASGHRLKFLQVTALDISASVIRERIAAGGSVAFLTPEPVVDFIVRQRLYRVQRPSE